MRMLITVLLLATSAQAINLQAPLSPDPVRTPGDVLTSDPNIICVSGYTKTVRNVPQAVKEQVYRSYGILSRASGEYEIDHLVSLELGGSNSVRNLWPESFKTQPLNAHVKDALENTLHDLACSGTITFSEAQTAIAKDWQAAYVKYLGPLPGGASRPSTRATVPAVGAAPVTPATIPAVPITGRLPASTGTGAGVAPLVGGACPASAPIKGNVSRTSRIYHLPQGDASYARTKAEQCFTTPQAAEAAGFRAARSP
jgi:hypothetical protein